MRKLLLSRMMLLMTAMVMGVGSMYADSWTWTASSADELGSTSTSAGSSATVTLNGKSWTVVRTLKSGSSYTGNSLTSGCIQLGKNGGVDNVSLKTSAFDGNKIKKVSVTCSSYNNAHKCSITVGETEYLAATATEKWTTIGTLEGTGSSEGEIDIEFTAGSRALYIKSITVEYEKASSVAKPSFSPDGGIIYAATTVTMSAAEGASIYYTTDGSAPTTSSTQGTSVVIPASGSTTLKAIAVVNNESSAIATAVYAYKDPSDLSESKTGFNTTGGVLEQNIFFESNQGGAGTAPGNYNNGIRLYQKSGTNAYGGFITLSASAGYLITGFTITTTSAYTTTVTYAVGNETPATSGTSVAASSDYSVDNLACQSVSIYNLGTGSSGRLEIAAIEVNYKISAIVQSYGWASYIAPAAVSFESGDAYVVTAASVADGLTVKDVSSVPAGTPVLLKGAGIKNITVVASATAPATNLLTVSDGSELGSGEYPYVLAKNSDGACFKQWTGDISDLTGRVVLVLDEAVATARSIFMLDDEATGIESIEHSPLTIEQSIYNLNGQRVVSPQKGLYIVNGKKVMMK